MNTTGATILQRTATGGYVNRVAPLLPAHAMKTFEVRQPLATHFRPLSCDEAQCPHKAAGWITGFDVSQPGRWDAAQKYGQIATNRGLTFKVHRVGDTVTFTFPAGQACLEGHRALLDDRPPLYIVRGGDWRGNPRGERRVHANAADFQDDWMESQARLDRERERG